jgi:hypothetical protein
LSKGFNLGGLGKSRKLSLDKGLANNGASKGKISWIKRKMDLKVREENEIGFDEFLSCSGLIKLTRLT